MNSRIEWTNLFYRLVKYYGISFEEHYNMYSKRYEVSLKSFPIGDDRYTVLSISSTSKMYPIEDGRTPWEARKKLLQSVLGCDVVAGYMNVKIFHYDSIEEMEIDMMLKGA